MKSVLLEKVYFFEDEDKFENRSALIYFRKGRFVKCSFTFPDEVGSDRKGFYNLDDWKFLQELAGEIIEISEKEAE